MQQFHLYVHIKVISTFFKMHDSSTFNYKFHEFDLQVSNLVNDKEIYLSIYLSISAFFNLLIYLFQPAHIYLSIYLSANVTNGFLGGVV